MENAIGMKFNISNLNRAYKTQNNQVAKHEKRKSFLYTGFLRKWQNLRSDTE